MLIDDLVLNSAVSGPRNMPNSMRKILHTIDSRLNAKNLYTSILDRIALVREPILRKFDRLHDEKVMYGGGIKDKS